MSEPERSVAFVDSNIWPYAFIRTQDVSRQHRAQAVLRSCVPILSPQVVNEVCLNLLRKAVFTEPQIQRLITGFYEHYLVIPIERSVALGASSLRQRYSLSYWDSIIVSSALHSPATLLYSEDMQDGLIIDQRLQLVNPFVMKG